MTRKSILAFEGEGGFGLGVERNSGESGSLSVQTLVGLQEGMGVQVSVCLGCCLG